MLLVSIFFWLNKIAKLVYWMIWWKCFLVFVYSFVWFLNILDLIVIAKIVFLNKQTNICWFKYELRGFYDFILINIAIGHYYIYRKQMKKDVWMTWNKIEKMFGAVTNGNFFQKWSVSAHQKWLITKKK